MARYELKTVVPLLFLCFIIGATARSFSTRLIFVLAGFFVVLLTAPTRVSNFIVNWRLESSNNAIYSLDHGRLNLQLPVESMWMNMGYWEVRSALSLVCTLIEQDAKIQPAHERLQDRMRKATVSNHSKS